MKNLSLNEYVFIITLASLPSLFHEMLQKPIGRTAIFPEARILRKRMRIKGAVPQQREAM
jgi:hypothetical protein